MKQIYLIIFLISSLLTQAQIVNIPDINFKNALINNGVDSNNDGEIQESEVSYIGQLELQNSNIANLTGIEFFTSLWGLNVSNNQLSSINLSNNNSLTFLNVSNNQLSSIDLSNNQYLERLFCENNQLSSLNISNNLDLKQLNCSNNQLTTLDISNNVNIWYLLISSNQYTELDLSYLSNLYLYNFSNNIYLNYINLKNGNNENMNTNGIDGYFYNLPNLQLICLDYLDDSYSSFAYQLQNTVDPNVVLTEYCSFTPGGDYFTISGNIDFDLDNNGCDSNDINFPNLNIQISDGTTSAAFFSNELGEYIMPIQAGNYTISPQLENPTYFSISPPTFNVNFPTDTSPYAQDLCITSNGNNNDLEIIIVPLEVARSGFETDYKIIYKNKGNTTLSGNIDFTFDDNYMDLLSSNPIADSQSIGNLIWNYSNLQPFETQEINFTMSLNTPTDTNFPLNIGDFLNYLATINPITSDEAPDDNTFNLNQEVVNSYDPNDKTCLEGETVTPEQVGKYVHYLVRFENTGNANAINVVVKDIINTTKYDLFSLIPLNASHDFNTRIRNENEVEFIFENIQLPFDDANNDGYILFKIKTLPTLNIGDSFSNEANIFFDYNAPIITNNETTTIQENLSIEEFNLSNIKIYPNPIADSFKIENLSNSTIKTIELFNISGKKIKQFSNSESYDVNDLPSGVYFIKIKTEQTETNRKLIKL